MVERLNRSAHKLDRMLGDLLDLDRLGRGIIEPRRRPTDMLALTQHVLSEAESTVAHRVSSTVDAIIADVDAAMVERILENLVANSVRHTPAGTPLWVDVRKADGGIEIVVADSGPGVPDELRAALFEPFRRGPDVPTHSPGVGIGLSLVQRFTQLHGGRAWIDERPGGGAAFHVFLRARTRRANVSTRAEAG
jgi:signal transduction histidine kinase